MDTNVADGAGRNLHQITTLSHEVMTLRMMLALYEPMQDIEQDPGWIFNCTAPSQMLGVVLKMASAAMQIITEGYHLVDDAAAAQGKPSPFAGYALLFDIPSIAIAMACTRFSPEQMGLHRPVSDIYADLNPELSRYLTWMSESAVKYVRERFAAGVLVEGKDKAQKVVDALKARADLQVTQFA